MKTEHGYDDTSKFLTQEQWDNATTEQRQGFLDEGYLIAKMDESPIAKMDVYE